MYHAKSFYPIQWDNNADIPAQDFIGFIVKVINGNDFVYVWLRDWILQEATED